MYDILSLILPLFGLIFLGYLAARITGRPLEALGWLNIFVIYFALPALFFTMLAKTPIEQLTRWDFIGANISVTFVILALIFSLGMVTTRGNIGEATIQAMAGGYGNIGYMGAALALLTLGSEAAIPLALIFCFETILHFSITPAMMALSGRGNDGPLKTAITIIRQIAFHPFIIATAIGVAAAAAQFSPPLPLQRLIDYLAPAAAPCALFAMGVTLALRPLKHVPGALSYIVPIKLVLHPLSMYLVLSYVGDFDRIWLLTAVLLAALPSATNVFVMAQQYGFWVERATASILVTTVFSVLSLSTLLYFIGTGVLPDDLFPAN